MRTKQFQLSTEQEEMVQRGAEGILKGWWRLKEAVKMLTKEHGKGPWQELLEKRIPQRTEASTCTARPV